MANINTGYGTQNQAVTITLINLASAAARQSTVVDSTVNKPLDVLLSGKITTGATSVASPFLVNVYVFATTDGTTYTEGAGASDAAITLVSPTNLILLGQINAPAITTAYSAGPWSIASAFGGSMPEKWGIVVENQTGRIFDATAGHYAFQYQEIYQTAA